jgi:hypothetical protein
MNGPSVTEVLTRITIIVGPFLLVGALIQYWLLRRIGLRVPLTVLALFVAGIVTVALTYVLLLLSVRLGLFFYRFGFGNPLVIAALVAAGLVTLAILGYARTRNRPAA